MIVFDILFLSSFADVTNKLFSLTITLYNSVSTSFLFDTSLKYKEKVKLNISVFRGVPGNQTCKSLRINYNYVYVIVQSDFW